MSLQLHQHPMAAIVYRSLLDTSMLWEMGREGTKCTLSKSHPKPREEKEGHSGLLCVSPDFFFSDLVTLCFFLSLVLCF